MVMWKDGIDGNPTGFDVKGNVSKYLAIFNAVDFTLRYGFDPTDKQQLTKIRNVRDYLAKHLGREILLEQKS